MKKVVFIILLLINVGCIGQNLKEISNTFNSNLEVSNDSIKNDSITTLKQLKLESDLSKSYGTIKNIIKKEQLRLNNTELSIDSLSNIFKLSLVNRIIPFWEGTEWSFEGHTSIPRKGKIACGYFVSTTLKDVGVNLNRYRLAQQSPIDEASSLALNTKVIEIRGNSITENILKIDRSIKEGIHFIGFDSSHVGYILKEKGQLYLIHSNYINYRGVEIEKIENSDVFASYNKYHIVELSTNENFLRSWIKGKEIK
ncbi:hypothetical protein [Aquimarina sp. I32.4]|uniref:hypothetical protein n=1 Tax=Aquimarina sp. I32.4 TaxID=2053903 RepID=UPI000CDEB36B|nr:hypothetical protein [Aquimarina sp. I32.4]